MSSYDQEFSKGYRAALKKIGAIKIVDDFYVRSIPEFSGEKLGINSDGEILISNGHDWETLSHKEGNLWINDQPYSYDYENFNEIPELVKIFEKQYDEKVGYRSFTKSSIKVDEYNKDTQDILSFFETNPDTILYIAGGNDQHSFYNEIEAQEARNLGLIEKSAKNRFQFDRTGYVITDKGREVIKNGYKAALKKIAGKSEDLSDTISDIINNNFHGGRVEDCAPYEVKYKGSGKYYISYTTPSYRTLLGWKGFDNCDRAGQADWLVFDYVLDEAGFEGKYISTNVQEVAGTESGDDPFHYGTMGITVEVNDVSPKSFTRSTKDNFSNGDYHLEVEDDLNEILKKDGSEYKSAQIHSLTGNEYQIQYNISEITSPSQDEVFDIADEEWDKFSNAVSKKGYTVKVSGEGVNSHGGIFFLEYIKFKITDYADYDDPQTKSTKSDGAVGYYPDYPSFDPIEALNYIKDNGVVTQADLQSATGGDWQPIMQMKKDRFLKDTYCDLDGNELDKGDEGAMPAYTLGQHANSLLSQYKSMKHIAASKASRDDIVIDFDDDLKNSKQDAQMISEHWVGDLWKATPKGGSSKADYYFKIPAFDIEYKCTVTVSKKETAEWGGASGSVEGTVNSKWDDNGNGWGGTGIGKPDISGEIDTYVGDNYAVEDGATIIQFVIEHLCDFFYKAWDELVASNAKSVRSIKYVDNFREFHNYLHELVDQLVAFNKAFEGDVSDITDDDLKDISKFGSESAKELQQYYADLKKSNPDDKYLLSTLDSTIREMGYVGNAAQAYLSNPNADEFDMQEKTLDEIANATDWYRKMSGVITTYNTIS